jgi:hypothetical protein
VIVKFAAAASADDQKEARQIANAAPDAGDRRHRFRRRFGCFVLMFVPLHGHANKIPQIRPV